MIILKRTFCIYFKPSLFYFLALISLFNTVEDISSGSQEYIKLLFRKRKVSSLINVYRSCLWQLWWEFTPFKTTSHIHFLLDFKNKMNHIRTHQDRLEGNKMAVWLPTPRARPQVGEWGVCKMILFLVTEDKLSQKPCPWNNGIITR